MGSPILKPTDILHSSHSLSSVLATTITRQLLAVVVIQLAVIGYLAFMEKPLQIAYNSVQ